jgi:hypothetical protein
MRVLITDDRKGAQMGDEDRTPVSAAAVVNDDVGGGQQESHHHHKVQNAHSA